VKSLVKYDKSEVLDGGLFDLENFGCKNPENKCYLFENIT